MAFSQLSFIEKGGVLSSGGILGRLGGIFLRFAILRG